MGARSDQRVEVDRRIVLVRHARSAHVQSGWLDASAFRVWRDAYEAVGIRPEESVPVTLGPLAEQADLVLASDAARAVESARLLAPGRGVLISPLLRELDLPVPDLAAVRMPLPAWALAVGMRILVNSLRGRHPSPSERLRVEEAATWLNDLALRHGRLLVVTHASFRSRLFRVLLSSGWCAEAGTRTLRPWSAWGLCRRLSDV